MKPRTFVVQGVYDPDYPSRHFVTVVKDMPLLHCLIDQSRLERLWAALDEAAQGVLVDGVGDDLGNGWIWIGVQAVADAFGKPGKRSAWGKLNEREQLFVQFCRVNAGMPVVDAQPAD